MIIYIAFNTTNWKCYVGQTKYSLEYRSDGHISEAAGTSHLPFHKALRKYPDKFIWAIIDAASTFEELDEKEIFYINLYKTNVRQFGYNCTAGGGGIRGYRHSVEAIRKISEASKQQRHTEDSKRRISEKHRGKVLSEETRAKIRAKRKLQSTKGRRYKVDVLRKRKAVDQYDQNGNFIMTFPDAYSAARHVNGSNSMISAVMRGVRKSHRGFVWKYHSAT